MVHWPDLGYSARFTAKNEEPSSIDVEIIESNHLNREILYDKGLGGFTTNSDEAEVAGSGFIKWDGCSHWSLGKNVMLHLCGKDGAEDFMNAMLLCFDEAAKMMERDYGGF
jgi:hypothetical protein